MLTEKIRIVKKYIQFYFKTKNKHCIHSPFVYDFYINVLKPQNKCTIERYKYINTLRKSLYSSDNSKSTEDIGASSKTTDLNKSLEKKIKNISQTRKGGIVLSRLTEFSKAKTIIELGTGGGIGTLYLREGNQDANIYTIEGNDIIAAQAKSLFEVAQAKNIHLIHGIFEDVLPDLLNSVEKVDLVFIDGDHTKDGTLKYFNMLLPYIHEHTVLVFHDIYWSDDMEAAWKEISNHLEVSLSIDVFYFGIALFSKRYQKEHYRIRI